MSKYDAKELLMHLGSVTLNSAGIEERLRHIVWSLTGDHTVAHILTSGLRLQGLLDVILPLIRFRAPPLEDQAKALVAETRSSIEERNDLVHAAWKLSREEEPRLFARRWPRANKMPTEDFPAALVTADSVSEVAERLRKVGLAWGDFLRGPVGEALRKLGFSEGPDAQFRLVDPRLETDQSFEPPLEEC